MITVLITTYNNAKYIGYTISSILNQLYKNFELLIVDDGSDDDTELIVKKFNDKRIVYKKISRSGRAKALNFGLREAANDWIVLADSDDPLYPEKLQVYSNYISEKENLILCSWSYYFQEKIIFPMTYPLENQKIKELLKLHAFNNAVLYNKNFILKNNGYDENLSIAVDYDLWLRLYDSAEFKILPKYLTLHRFLDNSLSRAKQIRTNQTLMSLHNKYYGKYTNEVKSRKETKLFAWREFFFGNKESARMIFLKLNILILFNLKILLAVLLTYLSDENLIQFKRLVIKYRLKYYLFYFSSDSINARNLLKEINSCSM